MAAASWLSARQRGQAEDRGLGARLGSSPLLTRGGGDRSDERAHFSTQPGARPSVLAVRPPHAGPELRSFCRGARPASRFIPSSPPPSPPIGVRARSFASHSSGRCNPSPPSYPFARPSPAGCAPAQPPDTIGQVPPAQVLTGGGRPGEQGHTPWTPGWPMSRRTGVAGGGIKGIVGKGLGERRASEGDRWGGAADTRFRRTAPGRRGEGSEAGGEAAGENGEERPSPRERWESLQKVPYPSGTVAEENHGRE